MESDLGKLFIGGISWDTNEDRLKDYFEAYGEVAEVVIMRDRTTGRARGFGFVVFGDPTVAEKVVREKHTIDGRTVEAKKAVPRDDNHIISRNNHSNQGSPALGRTKKIFVGGLASTVTESDFKLYFDQFGTVADAVVMYDHNTQRPRGFGFITYDSEEAVDRVLHKTFHELNGKMVEVKRAVPKELSPGPNRSPLVGYNYGFGRTNNFPNSYGQGYNLGPIGGYGVRMNGTVKPVVSGRCAFPPIGSPAIGMNMSLEPGLSQGFGRSSSFSNNLGYGRTLSLSHGGNSNRYITPIGFNGGNGRNESFLNSPTRNVWANVGPNSSATGAPAFTYMGSGNGIFGVFGDSSASWGSPPVLGKGGERASGYSSNIEYGGGENSYQLGATGLGRNIGPGGAATSPFVSSTVNFERSYGDLYSGSSRFEDAPWQSAYSVINNDLVHLIMRVSLQQNPR
ncbi:uncharacterized protein LOC141707942 [Apium graveolens]|uniref:uncharacterized protein LOC141707942 n=1 Tax=Apium graveolens TaxID=4045 RepID=UPI003D7BA594